MQSEQSKIIACPIVHHNYLLQRHIIRRCLYRRHKSVLYEVKPDRPGSNRISSRPDAQQNPSKWLLTTPLGSVQKVPLDPASRQFVVQVLKVDDTVDHLRGIHVHWMRARVPVSKTHQSTRLISLWEFLCQLQSLDCSCCAIDNVFRRNVEHVAVDVEQPSIHEPGHATGLGDVKWVHGEHRMHQLHSLNCDGIVCVEPAFADRSHEIPVVDPESVAHVIVRDLPWLW